MALFSYFRNTSKEIDVLKHDVGIFKNLINERQHPLDLVRELLSNAAAKEVGATRIEIGYTRDQQGHVFEVSDNGCGMDFSDNANSLGRLDRFLGLGLSSIVGQRSDEFSWKGLGSKLSYQSRKVMIETRSEGHSLYEVRINEPWDMLKTNQIPRPRITEHRNSDFPAGTRIRVLGHPPHRQETSFTFDEIKRYLLHRTFAGYTGQRMNPPQIVLSVMGRSEQLDFGWPEFRDLHFPEGLELDAEHKTLLVNMSLVRPTMTVRVRGFLTWEPERYGLSDECHNTGLILSSRGIPYFRLPLDEYGAYRIVRGNPGAPKICLVADCNRLHSEMNLARSGLVDSALTMQFQQAATQLMGRLEGSGEYAAFREVKASARRAKRAATIEKDQLSIGSDEQRWVVFDGNGDTPQVLMREPKNETEVIAILGKLESLGALPFAKFQTVGHPSASRSPDLFVNFQEDPWAGSAQLATFKAQSQFYSFKQREATHPSVICWDVPTRGRRVQLQETTKRYKFVVDSDGARVPVYVMNRMDGLKLMTTAELRARGVNI
jgi:hypothetical protein